jgi:hypothetical protein
MDGIENIILSEVSRAQKTKYLFNKTTDKGRIVSAG